MVRLLYKLKRIQILNKSQMKLSQYRHENNPSDVFVLLMTDVCFHFHLTKKNICSGESSLVILLKKRSTVTADFHEIF